MLALTFGGCALKRQSVFRRLKMCPKTALLDTKSSAITLTFTTSGKAKTGHFGSGRNARPEAAERFQAIENVPQNGSLGDKILPSNEAQVRPLSQLGTHRPTRAHLPVADDQIEHTGGLAVQWCRVWCRSWPPMRSIEYRTGRRYPRRLAGAVLRDVCQCLDSSSHLPFRIAAVSAFCDPAGRPAPGRMPPCFID